jgi:hypothetical protein
MERPIEAKINGYWYVVEVIGVKAIWSTLVAYVRCLPTTTWDGRRMTPKPFKGSMSRLEPLSETEEGIVRIEDLRAGDG